MVGIDLPPRGCAPLGPPFVCRRIAKPTSRNQLQLQMKIAVPRVPRILGMQPKAKR